jgi:hypothetical protein
VETAYGGNYTVTLTAFSSLVVVHGGSYVKEELIRKNAAIMKGLSIME